MQLRQLNIKDVAPFVRFVQRYEVPDRVGSGAKFLTAYDHRLFYVRHGSGQVEFTDRVYPLNRGDLIIWPSGWQYRQSYSSEDEPLVLLGCNFDYTQENSHFAYPIPPDTSDNFHPDGIFENIRIPECPFSDGPIYLHNMQTVEAELEEMLREYRSQLNFTAGKLSGILLTILCTAFRQIMAEDRVGGFQTSTTDAIIEYLHQHYAEDLNNYKIGEIFKYHPNYINKQMVQVTGKSLHQYLIAYRISRAIDLLTTTDEPVGRIATEVGFNDIPHFTRIFRQRTGQTPNDYRRKG